MLQLPSMIDINKKLINRLQFPIVLVVYKPLVNKVPSTDVLSEIA